MFDRDLIPFLFGLNSTVMWIALTVGLLLFIIGYIAGGSKNFMRLIGAIIMATLISVLSLPAPMALYKVIKEQFGVETYYENKSVSAPSKNADTEKAAEQPPKTETNSTDGSAVKVHTVPLSFQALTLVLYIVWTIYVVGMGVFFYETLITTVQEADKK